MAENYGALHVRTHALFQRQSEYRGAEHFCPEPVHPNQRGHMIIALELWRVVCGEGSAVPSNSA